MVILLLIGDKIYKYVSNLLAFFFVLCYHLFCRTRWGASGALYLQPAIAESNGCLGKCWFYGVKF